MAMLFSICAVVGGTILICQFVLTLVGIGGEHTFDSGPDVGGYDAAHDFSVDGGHDAVGGHDVAGEGHDAGHGHGSSWLFAVISFRTLVAAVTFFGLVGLAARSFEQGTGVQLLLAAAAGVGAMYGVHWLIRTIGRLGEDGTLRVRTALGQEGTVYIPIPAQRAQAGKIQLRLQGRLVDYEAVTNSQQRLLTGTKVRVVALTGNVLEVEPVTETQNAEGTMQKVEA